MKNDEFCIINAASAAASVRLGEAASDSTQRDRRVQMTRSQQHSRTATSAADRIIFKGVQELRNKERSATDHWMGLFSPLGPRSDLIRQSGEVLFDSRRTLTNGASQCSCCVCFCCVCFCCFKCWSWQAEAQSRGTTIVLSTQV